MNVCVKNKWFSGLLLLFFLFFFFSEIEIYTIFAPTQYEEMKNLEIIIIVTIMITDEKDNHMTILFRFMKVLNTHSVVVIITTL
jgi:hypothetical protein